MKIYFVMLEVIPSPDNPEDDCTGAYADCFVKADSEMTAVDSAKKYMQEQGCELDITDKRYHHEIYLSDVRKTAPEKLKTVIRHPIRKTE
jgi:hypothetical protein